MEILFNQEVIRTDKNGETITDLNGNPNPYLRGEATIVGLNSTFKANYMAASGATEQEFNALFTSASTGKMTRFYDVKLVDGSTTLALMSEKVIENSGGREPQEGDKWTCALRFDLQEDGTPKVDARGNAKTSLSIIGTPIVQLGGALASLLAGSANAAPQTANPQPQVVEAGQ